MMVSHGTPGGDAYLDLQNQARRARRPTDELLRLYTLEGFLSRLAVSEASKNLVLKGGVLLAAFGARRPTRDVDLAALQLSNDEKTVQNLVRLVIAAVPERDDGIEFDVNSLSTRPIRDEDEYSGVRVSLVARIASATIAFHIDVNVGDPIWPSPERIRLPRLRGGADFELLGYPLHMVHAEKIVTAIQRGTANTRWRDFGDIWMLSRQRSLGGGNLGRAIGRVAQHRNVTVGSLSDILDGFAEFAQAKWISWHHQGNFEHLPENFSTVLSGVVDFADPILDGSALSKFWDPESMSWQ